MRGLALSYLDLVPEKAKVKLKRAKQLFDGGGLINIVPPTITENQQDELDEKRMMYVLDMLVRLFYRDVNETGDRSWHEQELRRALILYLSGTGGTNQFSNFTNLFMSLELAVSFAASQRITPKDVYHTHAARLHGDTVRWRGATSDNRDSSFIKDCRKVLDKKMVGRICEYRTLNNRLKHYGRRVEDAKYFNDAVKAIYDPIARLRVDTAYVILLGLVKLYGKPSPPALENKARRTSKVILGMIADCMDRHSEKALDGGAGSKINSLMDVVNNEAIKSEKDLYYHASLAFKTFKMLVAAAGMLKASGVTDEMRTLVREYEDIAPDVLKPSKRGLVGEYDADVLLNWLLGTTDHVVRWMDGKFHIVYGVLHVARYGRKSFVKFDPIIF